MVTVNRLNNSRAASLPPLGNLKTATSAESTSLHCCLPLWVELGCHGAWLPWNSGRRNRHSPICSPSGVWEKGVWQREHQPKDKLNLEATVHHSSTQTCSRLGEETRRSTCLSNSLAYLNWVRNQNCLTSHRRLIFFPWHEDSKSWLTQVSQTVMGRIPNKWTQSLSWKATPCNTHHSPSWRHPWQICQDQHMWEAQPSSAIIKESP